MEAATNYSTSYSKIAMYSSRMIAGGEMLTYHISLVSNTRKRSSTHIVTCSAPPPPPPPPPRPPDADKFLSCSALFFNIFPKPCFLIILKKTDKVMSIYIYILSSMMILCDDDGLSLKKMSVCIQQMTLYQITDNK